MDNLLWNNASDENSFAQCPTLSDEIFRLLHHRILSGYYKRGERLSEAQLAAEWNISRSPIREAFIQLENTGLIKIVKRKGCHVLDFTGSDVREIAEMRLLIEQHIVKVLIEENRVDEKAIGQLQQILDAIDSVHKNTELSHEEMVYQASQLDFKFHLAMADLADRPAFFDLVKNTITRSRAIIGLLNIHPDTAMVLLDHNQFLEAFREKDVKKAQATVERHLRWMSVDDSPIFDAVEKK